MPAFKTKKVNIETLGEYLAEARTAHKLSPEQIQRLTQIPPRYLQALEAGNYQRLPADVYVKGFLKSLAAVYHVVPEPLLEQFEKERGIERSLKSDPLRPTPRQAYRQLAITPRTFSVTAVIVLAVASIGYLVWQVRSVAAPPELVLAYPAADTTVATRNILLRGKTEPGSRVYVNDQEVAVDESGEFREVVNLAVGRNPLLVRTQNKFGKTSQTARTVVVTQNPAQPTSTPVMAGTAPVDVAVTVGAKDTWVKAVADGRVAQDGIVSAGQEQTFTAQNEIDLSVGDAGQIRAAYNGQDLGVLGQPGEVLSNIRFTAR